MQNSIKTTLCFVLVILILKAQSQVYPKNYFRNPLDIPMQLVANFGEIRANHWHMGLDIRTQQKVNLPVHAAAEGYIARITIEPGGFGQAIYINHPNGFTTVYGHLNSFFPALAAYVKQKQYAAQSWNIDLALPENLFPVSKSSFIALSGSTGASEGPHVHFEIRDTRSGKCLNPLLFGFPIPDAAPPTLSRLALYNRERSTYFQTPVLYALQKSGNTYHLNSTIKTGFKKISFAIGATDHFSNSSNPNGIYSASLQMDGVEKSAFALDRIDYADTRYINAQLDYPLKSRGGASLQHIAPLPGEKSGVYQTDAQRGVLDIADGHEHQILISVQDANGNVSKLSCTVQYDPSRVIETATAAEDLLLPNAVTVIEKPGFELYTTENTLYDTAALSFNASVINNEGAASPVFYAAGNSIPAHDYITIRIKPNAWLSFADMDKMVIKNISGNKTFIAKASLQQGFATAKFRQFGTYEVFVDHEAPTINAPGPGNGEINLSHAKRIVLIPQDNFNSIKSLVAEIDGQWLCFSNDKGHSWIYNFEEHFPSGLHTLKVTVSDEAGNTLVKEWKVRR